MTAELSVGWWIFIALVVVLVVVVVVLAVRSGTHLPTRERDVDELRHKAARLLAADDKVIVIGGKATTLPLVLWVRMPERYLGNLLPGSATAEPWLRAIVHEAGGLVRSRLHVDRWDPDVTLHLPATRGEMDVKLLLRGDQPGWPGLV